MSASSATCIVPPFLLQHSFVPRQIGQGFLKPLLEKEGRFYGPETPPSTRRFACRRDQKVGTARKENLS